MAFPLILVCGRRGSYKWSLGLRTCFRTGPCDFSLIMRRGSAAAGGSLVNIIDSNHFQLHPTPVPSAGGWDGRQRVGGFTERRQDGMQTRGLTCAI